MTAKQLAWRCRRGVRELDVLLGRFVESEYQQLSLAEQKDFERLLDVQDPIIMDWLFARSKPADSGLNSLIHRLRGLSGLSS